MSNRILMAVTGLGLSFAAGAQSTTSSAIRPPQPAATSNAATTPSDIVGVRAALDQHLAESIKDPANASHYAVSEIIPCEAVIDAKHATGQLSNSACICYRVNASNTAGVNIGGQLNVAMTSSANGVYGISEVPVGNLSAKAGDGCKNLSSRDSDSIHTLVK